MNNAADTAITNFTTKNLDEQFIYFAFIFIIAGYKWVNYSFIHYFRSKRCKGNIQSLILYRRIYTYFTDVRKVILLD